MQMGRECIGHELIPAFVFGMFDLAEEGRFFKIDSSSWFLELRKKSPVDEVSG